MKRKMLCLVLIGLLIPCICHGFVIGKVFTGAADVDITVTPTEDFKILGIKGHLSGAGAANSLVVTIDHGSGGPYDTVIYTLDMTSVTDFSKTFDDLWCKVGDKITVAWTNGSTVTYGIEVQYETHHGEMAR